MFAAVASPARRRLLQLLLEQGPLPVQDLADHFAMRRPSVSEHLKLLKDAGLVTEEKSGRQRLYQLRPKPWQAVATWRAPYERFWRAKLADLRDLLDTEAQERDTDQEEDHHG